MAVVGDRVQVPSKRVGQTPREGVVVGASTSGLMLRVQWSSGEESTITPSMGSLVVLGRARIRAGKAGSASSSKKATKKTSKKAATKPGSKKASGVAKSGRAPAKQRSGKASTKGGRAPKRGK